MRVDDTNHTAIAICGLLTAESGGAKNIPVFFSAPEFPPVARRSSYSFTT